ncbi:hypothetical protein [Effusibacillus dendaii]|uniref:hypothetical protein n=1 Tax=Effusibacillus dendaii TaxID=2743772 RepID=UPI00190A9EF6|nr:hypothetical protein [Effusibacillus dendaii]
MASQEENRQIEATQDESAKQERVVEQVAIDSDSLPDDWFWRPLKRHTTKFLTHNEKGNAWREAGRRLPPADRFVFRQESRGDSQKERGRWKWSIGNDCCRNL